MTRDEAVAMARQIAETRGWVWHGRVAARLERRGGLLARLFGPARRWHVLSNASGKGCNVCVTIDDESGEVVRASFWPR
jgi:hypothetical protein